MLFSSKSLNRGIRAVEPVFERLSVRKCLR